MDLTLQQIYDYNACPMVYKFKHQMKVERIDEKPLESRYNDSMRKTIMFFFYQLLNERPPTLEQLRQKFGSIFYRNMEVEDILANSTLDNNLNAMNLQAMKVLETFYDTEADRAFTVVGVDMDLRVPIGDHALLATVDLVREIKRSDKPMVEVVHYTMSNKAADPFSVAHNLELTSSSYAFRKLFKSTENRLIIQYMKNCKEYITVRKEPELKKLEAIVTNVGSAISQGKFHPVLNSRCNYCAYKDICDKYKF